MKIYNHPSYSYVRIVEIPKNEIKKIDFALCKQPRETLLSFYNRQTVKPDIVSNLGFFDMNTGGTCFNFISEYQVINKTDSYQWGMGVKNDADLEYNGLPLSSGWRCFISGYPNLIGEGKKINIDFAKELNYKARRTMLGYNDTTIFLVLAEKPGLAYPAMQSLMLGLGCKYAINCDGGGSTKALHQGKSITKDSGDRAVDNVLAIYLNEENGPERSEKDMIPCFKGKFKMTSNYGYRTMNGKQEWHPGYDLVAIDDWNIYAPCDGVIASSGRVYTGTTAEWGNYIKLNTADGYSIFMCHLASRCVVKGQKVKKGDKLGVMGSTGKSTGPHVHYEIRVTATNKAIDPSKYSGIPNKKGTYEADWGAVSNNANNIDVIYQSYSKGQWWSKITNYNVQNSSGYSGVEGCPIHAVKIALSKGSVQYRVHTINGKWLNWITDSKGNGSDSYAGVIGKNIDAIQIKLIGDIAKTHNIKYRTSVVGSNNYLNWIDGVNGTGTSSYSGIIGRPIDKIQISIEPK